MYPSAIEITSKLHTALASTRTVVEFSATTFSNGFTYAALSAIESGAITRKWWQRQGKDQMVQLSWVALRALALLVMFSVCFGLWAVYATRVTWVWINRATDDGLGLYGHSPMLAGWLGRSNCQIQEVRTLEESTETKELIDWAVARWPELKKFQNIQ